MTARKLYGYLALPWYWIRPIEPQYRSREAWTEHCRKLGKKPDGTPL
jgi:hypothetical protein